MIQLELILDVLSTSNMEIVAPVLKLQIIKLLNLVRTLLRLGLCLTCRRGNSWFAAVNKKGKGQELESSVSFLRQRQSGPEH